MSAINDVELDPTDERIIEMLRMDGRVSYRAMAAALDLTEATVRSRVRRLEQSNEMRVVAVTDFQAAGYELLLAVGIQVSGRTPAEVAAALAEIPEIFSINIMIGAYDIEVLAVAADQAALTALLYDRLANLPGVKRVEPSMAMNVLKNQPDWVPLAPQMPTEEHQDVQWSGSTQRDESPAIRAVVSAASAPVVEGGSA